jgi:hypothetical protein
MSLEREMRQVLAELALLLNGKTQTFYATGGKSENPDPRPQGESKPPHEYWAQRWAACPDHGTVLAAREALNAWKRRVVTSEGDGTNENQWLLEDGEGYTADEVARRFNTTPSRVRSLRLADDREMEFGKKIHGNRVVPRVQDLVEQGMGARAIAMLTGMKRSTAQDAVNKHRKAA